MKKIKLYLLLFFLMGTTYARAQSYFSQSKSIFRPLTLEEISMVPDARRKAEDRKMFEENCVYAYKALERKELQGFIMYSNNALENSSGWYSPKLYYDRGCVFEALGKYESAEQELYKAWKLGYPKALYRLMELYNKEYDREK